MSEDLNAPPHPRSALEEEWPAGDHGVGANQVQGQTGEAPGMFLSLLKC